MNEVLKVYQASFAVVISPDTDVLMLLIDYAQSNTELKLTFVLLGSKGKRSVDITSVCDTLGTVRTKAILASRRFHINWMRSDQSIKFNN